MQTHPTAPTEIRHLDLSRIAQDLQIRKVQVESVVRLLDDENTIPFIARYRKEATGGLDEEALRVIQDRVRQLRKLADRKQTILKSLELNGKLTPELRAAILAADHPKRLEDLYLPYKRKDKATRADKARERGLAPLADAIWYADPAAANFAEMCAALVNPEKELATADDVRGGVQDLLAERVAEAAPVRDILRRVLWDTGRIVTAKSEKLAEGQGQDYKDYFQFSEAVKHIPPHRVLALNRGEKANVLAVKLEWDAETGLRVALDRLPLPPEGTLPPLPGAPPQTTAPELSPSDSSPPATDAAPQEPDGTRPAEVAGATPAPAEGVHAVTIDAEAATEAETSGAVAETPPDSANETPAGEAAPPPGNAAPARPPRGPRGAAHRIHYRPLATHPHAEFLREVTVDALQRLLVPSLEREIRRELTTRAEQHAVDVFARNLRSKLLAPPLRGRRLLAIDPAFRTGCKCVVLDEVGNLLEDAVVFPHPPQNKRAEATVKLEELIRKHQTTVIAIGNGTACRETEEVVSELLADLEARRTGVPRAAAPTVEPSPATQQTPVATEPIAAEPAATDTSPPTEASSPAEATSPAIDAAPATAEAAAPVAEVPATVSTPPPQVDPSLPPAPADLAYIIVNEAGASVYSASPVGREEFPDLDITVRGTVSIGRRLQDPLSELVKIDPQHVGVGLYQHDVHPKQLRESLDAVVESCVNAVGVDLNTAGVALLRHVSGLNQLAARELVEFRKTNGPFREREQLLQVPGIGERRFTQAAGFLKVIGGSNPLDGTWIHPESYAVATRVLSELGYAPESLIDRDKVSELREKLKSVPLDDLAKQLDLGPLTVRDILEALARPGHDPRDDVPPPVFKKGVLKIEDLQVGMELKGTVLNVVDFGAFVDVGLKDSGLVHISQLANRYVKDPHDVVTVGDVVSVWVLSVDRDRHRVSLTMIAPGTERKPPEKKAPPPRRERLPREQQPRQPGEQDQREPAPGGERDQRPRRPHPGRRPPEGGRPAAERGTRRAAPPPPQRREGPLKVLTAQQVAEQAAQAAAAAAATTGDVPPKRVFVVTPPPQPKPRRQGPKPKLSEAALAGKEALNTFGQLAAFWAARQKQEEGEPPPPQPVEQPVEPPAVAAEEVPTPPA